MIEKHKISELFDHKPKPPGPPNVAFSSSSIPTRIAKPKLEYKLIPCQNVGDFLNKGWKLYGNAFLSKAGPVQPMINGLP